jgi:hypothetical protein
MAERGEVLFQRLPLGHHTASTISEAKKTFHSSKITHRSIDGATSESSKAKNT